MKVGVGCISRSHIRAKPTLMKSITSLFVVVDSRGRRDACARASVRATGRARGRASAQPRKVFESIESVREVWIGQGDASGQRESAWGSNVRFCTLSPALPNEFELSQQRRRRRKNNTCLRGIAGARQVMANQGVALRQAIDRAGRLLFLVVLTGRSARCSASLFGDPVFQRHFDLPALFISLWILLDSRAGFGQNMVLGSPAAPPHEILR